MAHSVITPEQFDWITRPHAEGEPARHIAELSEVAAFADVRANVWRYEPGAKGRRHRHPTQEETFVVLSGTLSMYVGDPPSREEVPAGGLITVRPGTPLQSVNHGDSELLVYAYGFRPRTRAPSCCPPPSSAVAADDLPVLPFASAAEWEAWLEDNHAAATASGSRSPRRDRASTASATRRRSRSRSATAGSTAVARRSTSTASSSGSRRAGRAARGRGSTATRSSG